MSIQLLQFDGFGNPGEVLRCVEVELPPMLADQVRLRMILSPINPSDINFIEGKYGLKPQLPAVAGLEGVGEVVEIGSQVTTLRVGQLVSPPRSEGLWRSEVVVHASQVELFAEGLRSDQAAVSRTNPPTAWAFLNEFVSLEPGDWVVQNAANSAVGRAVIQMAHDRGLRTLNIVRRSELAPELQEIGADVVLTMEEIEPWQSSPGSPQISAKLGLNAVGGESALAVAKFLCPGGIHVTYGAMGRMPLKIPNGLLIFGELTFRGFWLTPWLAKAPPEKVKRMQSELVELWKRGVLTPGIERAYPLTEYKEALAHASRGERKGKIVFSFQPGRPL